MTLFDDIVRKDHALKLNSEPEFNYLNRSARSICEETRLLLEEWFTRFPESAKVDLKARFRSRRTIDHWAAYSELLMHEFLVRLGAIVKAHPEIEGSTRTPDFIARWPNGESCYVEVTMTTGELGEQLSTDAIKRDILDELDLKVVSDRFTLWIDFEGVPTVRQSIKPIVEFLNEQLTKLDFNELVALLEEGGIDALPQWPFNSGGWILTVRPIPMKENSERSKAVGVQMGDFGVADHRTPLRDKMLDKAGAYPPLDAPYIIAVNALDLIDDIDVDEALFGQEVVTVRLNRNDPTKHKETVSRLPGGLWIGRSGPRYTRVSAVLAMKKHLPMLACSNEYSVLIHNPWAKNPCMDRHFKRYFCLIASILPPKHPSIH